MKKQQKPPKLPPYKPPVQSCKESLPINFSSYLFRDYTFLNQYQLIQSFINSQNQFLAKIKDTQQYVKFIKRQFISTNTSRGLIMYRRFQTLFLLFQKGLILADNMFILQQGDKKYYYYLIEPYLSIKNNFDSPFMTLQQYLFQNRFNIHTFQSRKTLFLKCKNLIDNLVSTQQAYCGLNSKKIVIDEEGKLYLMPFNLQPQLINIPYQRAYYPKQILNMLIHNKQIKQQHLSMKKWDIWSFGCICTEIFLYLTPFFISTSVQQQISKINKQIKNIFQDLRQQILAFQHSQSSCSLTQQIASLNQQKHKILTFFYNALNLEQSKRSNSFQCFRQNTEQIVLKQSSRSSKLKRSMLRMLDRHKKQNSSIQKINSQKINQKALQQQTQQNKRIQDKTQDQFIELNVCQRIFNQVSELREQNLKLQLKFISIEFNHEELMQVNAQQFAITIKFQNNERYKFYLDIDKRQKDSISKKKKCDSIVQINKKLTFNKQSFKFIQELLQEDIQISIKANHYNQQKLKNDIKDSKESQSLIYLNLSTLTIKNDHDNRIWRKPIKGTYESEEGSLFKCKIKIQASVKGLNQTYNDELQQTANKILLSRLQMKHVSNVESLGNSRSQSIQKNQQNLKIIKTQKYKQETANIHASEIVNNYSSPFSKINTQLDQISKYWKQKISDEDQQQFVLKERTQNKKNILANNNNNQIKVNKTSAEIKNSNKVDDKNQNRQNNIIQNLIKQNIATSKTNYVRNKLKKLLMS